MPSFLSADPTLSLMHPSFLQFPGALLSPLFSLENRREACDGPDSHGVLGKYSLEYWNKGKREGFRRKAKRVGRRCLGGCFRIVSFIEIKESSESRFGFFLSSLAQARGLEQPISKENALSFPSRRFVSLETNKRRRGKTSNRLP